MTCLMCGSINVIAWDDPTGYVTVIFEYECMDCHYKWLPNKEPIIRRFIDENPAPNNPEAG
jgi:hypothetical protein